jgi:hypothetical protein
LKFFLLRVEAINVSNLAENMAFSSDYPNAKTFAQAMSDESFLKLSEEYENFKNKVRQGSLGETAQFWMSYNNCV